MSESEENIIRATSARVDFGKGANIIGFHLEGPFINKECKGAMNEKYIIPPSRELFDKCKRVARITVAPEIEGNMEFIKDCPVQVSIGHTKADYDTASEAFRCGATSLTHTYNVMPGIHHRAPGPIGACSDNENVFAELIADGIHIHPAAVRLLYKLYGSDHITIISDSMQATAVGDGDYVFGGLNIRVESGVARTESGNLAGSTTCLFDCVREAIKMGIPEEEAVKMASETPARLMGLNKGKIEVGYDADFIVVDGEFNLIRAIVRGEF